MNVDGRVRGEPFSDLDLIMRGVVVHDQVKLLVGVGPGDLLEEVQELLAPMPGHTCRSDLAVAISNSANRVVVCAAVVSECAARAGRVASAASERPVRRLELGLLISDRALG